MIKIPMDINELINYLPHRYPFLLIDRVVEYIPGQSLTALKNVTSNEPYFVGHFPQRKVMPGVLILEALAQAGAIMAYMSTNTVPDEGSLYYFAGIDNARFKQVVIPGDQLRLSVVVEKVRRNFWKLNATASVDNKVVCTADLLSVKQENNE